MCIRDSVRSTTLGEIYNPAEAVTAGFLDRLVPADEVEAAALKVAEDLVPLRYAFNTVKEYERSALLDRCRRCLEHDLEAFVKRS